MALNLSDVEKIAKLSRLSLTENEKTKTLSELNDIFAMVEKMQSVNTDGVIVCRSHQWRLPIFVLGVNVRAGLYQDPQDFRIFVLFGRKHQRRQPIFVFGVDVRSSLQQRSQDFWI